MNLLSPQQIADVIQAAAGTGFQSARCTEWAEGIQGRKSKQVWIHLTRESLIPALKRLVEIHFPHVSVIAFADVGEAVELMYHFYIYWGIPHEEILVTFTVALSKTDLRVPTITGILPGALTSEREKQEMLGIEIVDIPDGRHLFLHEDFPVGVYPWRKDGTGIPPDMIKNRWATGREGVATCVSPPAPPPPPPPPAKKAE